MISLCVKTLALAEKKTNFSGWVRAMLLQEEERNKPAKKRFRYDCDECDHYFIVKETEHNDFFYCPNMMRGRGCDNTHRLKGEEVVDQ